MFIRNALMFNKKHRVLSEDEVRSVMKIGCVSAIAPACSIIVVALGLVSLIGPVLSFMRVGVIGSAAYETQMAEIAGIHIGRDTGNRGDNREHPDIVPLYYDTWLCALPY